MNLTYRRWKQLLIFCTGLSIGTAFCMKWLETDFLFQEKKFTMMGLELFYSKKMVTDILSGIVDHVRTVLNYHLHFDFIFMAGIFPGISCLCMMAREKVISNWLKRILFTMAVIQLLAWAGDVTENLYLIKWVEDPTIGNEFGLYHAIVAAKWIIALTGFFFAVVTLVIRRKIKPEIELDSAKANISK